MQGSEWVGGLSEERIFWVPPGGPLPSLALFDNRRGNLVGLSSGTDVLRLGARQAPGKIAEVTDFVPNTSLPLGVLSSFPQGPEEEGQ